MDLVEYLKNKTIIPRMLINPEYSKDKVSYEVYNDYYIFDYLAGEAFCKARDIEYEDRQLNMLAMEDKKAQAKENSLFKLEVIEMIFERTFDQREFAPLQ